MSIIELVKLLRDDGFKQNRARVKVCQEVFMTKLALSTYKDSVLFKGGTIMYQLSKELRRSTEDVDIDLIRLSITDKNLINILNQIGIIDTGNGITFSVVEDQIELLKHESYEGKRVILLFKDDFHNTLKLKLDIGIHTKYQIKQDTILFDLVSSDDGIELLANPIEQMIVEKTSSFIRFGVLSTRMKDLYDIYYLISNHRYSKKLIIDIIEKFFIDSGQFLSLNLYVETMVELLQSDMLIGNMSRSDNWTGSDSHSVTYGLTRFFNTLLISK
ncbi:MAG: nucleotidyl transferase AbiEii/AbiGii toxin family protein [Tenericutes bacterium]|jgi:predicted nucleotidyltransferase component of viral defense system|nr:nucleotidyl transferase AbiEii/AbiGii toxin family protein [Mycoplasmatota bacterium]